MCASAILLSADPSLGRVNYSLMSDQTLMEMLIEGFDDETKQKYKDDGEMYLDVCDWSCTKCDDAERVIQAEMHSANVSGSVKLCYIPPKMKVLKITTFGISNLTGSIDLTQLPEGMQKLSLGNNKFTGEIDLTQLPDGMNMLFLDCNRLTGEVNLTHLPEGMQRLHLEYNQLRGEVDLAHLPNAMEFLSLVRNQFSGPLVIKKLPQRMNTIDVRGNFFNAIAVVETGVHVSIKLKRSGVTSVVEENGRELNMNLFLKHNL